MSEQEADPWAKVQWFSDDTDGFQYYLVEHVDSARAATAAQHEAELSALREQVARLRLERDSAKEQFDKHVAWASEQIDRAGQPLPPPVSDADIIAAIRTELWEALRGRELGGDRTLVGMVKQLREAYAEARENRRGEFELREIAEARIQQLTEALAKATTLAKEATNGWACYARTNLEHNEIARLHREIDAALARQEQP